MIINERESEFVMIEQHNHAVLSGDLFSYLQEELFTGKELKQDILFATQYHDCAWIGLDTDPLWDVKIILHTHLFIYLHHLNFRIIDMELTGLNNETSMRHCFVVGTIHLFLATVRVKKRLNIYNLKRHGRRDYV